MAHQCFLFAQVSISPDFGLRKNPVDTVRVVLKIACHQMRIDTQDCPLPFEGIGESSNHPARAVEQRHPSDLLRSAGADEKQGSPGRVETDLNTANDGLGRDFLRRNFNLSNSLHPLIGRGPCGKFRDTGEDGTGSPRRTTVSREENQVVNSDVRTDYCHVSFRQPPHHLFCSVGPAGTTKRQRLRNGLSRGEWH